MSGYVTSHPLCPSVPNG